MAGSSNEFLPTRKSLLTRLKSWDDQEGWREFFDTYWKLIYNVARKSGFSDAESQDVVQDTVIGVAKKMKQFRYDPAAGSFKAWLLLNTRSRIVERLRKRRLPVVDSSTSTTGTSRTPRIARVPDSAGSNLEALWESEWKQNLLSLALQRVKQQVAAKQFQLFELYVIQEMPVAAITKSLGVSATQVYLAKLRLSRLLQSEIRRLESQSE